MLHAVNLLHAVHLLRVVNSLHAVYLLHCGEFATFAAFATRGPYAACGEFAACGLKVMHLDLKRENIMVSGVMNWNGMLLPKLTLIDFGLSQVLPPGQDRIQLVDCGSPGYLGFH